MRSHNNQGEGHNFVLERVFDLESKEVGLDPASIRNLSVFIWKIGPLTPTQPVSSLFMKIK